MGTELAQPARLERSGFGTDRGLFSGQRDPLADEAQTT